MAKKKMKRSDWIKNALRKNQYNTAALLTKENFEKYKEETGSWSSFSSYKSYMYIILKEETQNSEDLENSQEEEDTIYDAEYLQSILEQETAQNQRKLKYSDLQNIADKHGFSVRSFHISIPDLSETLSNIYRVNSLDFQPEVDQMKLKRQIDTLEKENRTLKKDHVDVSVVVDTLQDIVQEYKPWEAPNYIPSNRSSARELVALYSDLHAGELVSLEETHGLNEYNTQTMKKRIDIFFEKMIEFATELKTDVLHFKMLGDMINGEIHEELVRNADADTLESLILIADYTAQWIRRISEFFREINILAVSGNHGRFSKKPNFKKRNTLNFDFISYEFMRRELRDVVDNFDLPKSFFVIRDILGYKFLSMHGDTLKGGTGLNPISGTWGRDVGKIESLYSDQGGFDYAEFAHFHTSILDMPTFSGVSMIANGSIKGADEFSIGAVKKGEAPSQTVYVVEENEGVKFRTSLNLEE